MQKRKHLNVYNVLLKSPNFYQLECAEFFEAEELDEEVQVVELKQKVWVSTAVLTKMKFVGTYYVVMAEHTLGYISDVQPNDMGVLAGSVVRGGHNHLNGMVSIVPGFDKLRIATEQDFKDYRVRPPKGYSFLQEVFTAPTLEQVLLWGNEADSDFGSDEVDMPDSIIGQAAVERLVAIAFAAGRTAGSAPSSTATRAHLPISGLQGAGIELSPWVTDQHGDVSSLRFIKGTDPGNVANRVAVIEKTPRVRVKPCALDVEDYRNWRSGCSGEGGWDAVSQGWCDTQLLAMGYLVPDPKPFNLAMLES